MRYSFLICMFLLVSCSRQNPIEGIWVPISAELNGRPFPDEILKTIQLSIKGNDYVVNVGGVVDHGYIILDTTKIPMTMDIVGTEGPNKGKTIPAIYKVENRLLIICYDLDGHNRPVEFKSKPQSQLFLATYKAVTG
jgi:uncharacterized protein (TIGR03067 family)